VLQGCLQQLSKNSWILQVVVPPVIALLQVAADGLTSNTTKNSDQAGRLPHTLIGLFSGRHRGEIPACGGPSPRAWPPVLDLGPYEAQAGQYRP
jgi:hypothetical protein